MSKSKINPNIFNIVNMHSKEKPKLVKFINEKLLISVYEKGNNYRIRDDIKDLINDYFKEELNNEN